MGENVNKYFVIQSSYWKLESICIKKEIYSIGAYLLGGIMICRGHKTAQKFSTTNIPTNIVLIILVTLHFTF